MNEELNKKLEQFCDDEQEKNLKAELGTIEETIHYTFSDKSLFVQAFTRSSYSVEHGIPSNEILEFIGDKVIDFVVVKDIAEKFRTKTSWVSKETKGSEYFTIATNKNEGDFTEIKKNLVCNENFSKVIDDLGLAKYMLLGKSDSKNKVEEQMKIKADLLEAIVGATAIDTKWDVIKLSEVCEKLIGIDSYLSKFMISEKSDVPFHLDNAITVLKELAEHGWCSMPQYLFSDDSFKNENGDSVWTCVCYIRSHNITSTVEATSKKFAKKYAAFDAICKMLKAKNSL